MYIINLILVFRLHLRTLPRRSDGTGLGASLSRRVSFSQIILPLLLFIRSICLRAQPTAYKRVINYLSVGHVFAERSLSFGLCVVGGNLPRCCLYTRSYVNLARHPDPGVQKLRHPSGGPKERYEISLDEAFTHITHDFVTSCFSLVGSSFLHLNFNRIAAMISSIRLISINEREAEG